jgi:hypothetical protein
MEELLVLAGDEPRLDELFARSDNLLQGSQDARPKSHRVSYVDELKTHLKILVQAGDVPVRLSHPQADARLPWISVMPERGGEDPGGAVAGQLLDQKLEAIGPLPTSEEYIETGGQVARRLIRHRIEGTEWNTTVSVGCWATSGEEAELLASVVRHLVFRVQGQLADAGVYDIALSESGFEPDTRMHPRTMWVPTVQCRIRWQFKQTRRQRVPYAITVGAGSFSN